MVWVWFATGVLTGMACLYWWNRAKEAEKDAAENLKSLLFWQERACEMSRFLKELQAEQEADTNEESLVEEYVGAEPNITDGAQMFNFASEAFYYRWLAWNPRHD